MEEIVFVEEMGGLMEVCTSVIRGEHGKEIEFEKQVGSDGSRSSSTSMIFESIGGSNSSMSASNSNEALEENFEHYFKSKCKKKISASKNYF